MFPPRPSHLRRSPRSRLRAAELRARSQDSQAPQQCPQLLWQPLHKRSCQAGIRVHRVCPRFLRASNLTPLLHVSVPRFYVAQSSRQAAAPSAARPQRSSARSAQRENRHAEENRLLLASAFNLLKRSENRGRRKAPQWLISKDTRMPNRRHLAGAGEATQRARVPPEEEGEPWASPAPA